MIFTYFVNYCKIVLGGFMNSFFGFLGVVSMLLWLQSSLPKKWHKITVLVTNLVLLIIGMFSGETINIYYFLLLFIMIGILIYYIWFKKEEKTKEITLKKWSFGTNNDYLVDLVLSGKKTATTSLYDYLTVPVAGEESILTYSNGKKACTIKTTMVMVTEFKNITWDLAKLEGENNSLEEWRSEHIDFFKSIDNNFNENTKVVFEIFEVV